jgi:uncharacterized protein YegJ (DUF2314 family)
MRFFVFAAALLLAFPLAACSGADNEMAAEAKYEKDVAAASEQARGKLAYFWEHFEAPEVDEYDFSLKVAFPRRDGQEGTEDAWVENIARDVDSLKGELMVDPKYLGELRGGAIMDFSEKQIVDWSFLRGEELIGHYTTRVMLPRMNPEQAEGLRSMFGENPT